MTELDRTAAMHELHRVQTEMKLLAAEATLDVMGIADPTPTCDLAAATLAMNRGDLWSAGLSLLAAVPYLGDALAKPMKGARHANRVADLQSRTADLVRKMADNPGLDAASHGRQGTRVALTDKGIGSLSRGLNLPPWATDFSAWRGRKVLDAGAGGGSFVRELKAMGIDAYGFDLVADTFKKAGIRNNDHFVQATIERIPMRDKAFDAATSNWSVFYYFERGSGDAKTATYLAELVRVVKPGGEIRLFGVDPRVASVVRRRSDVRIERSTPEDRQTIPVMILRVL